MLTEWTDGLWSYERMHAMKGGLTMPLRATAMRLSTGSLCVYAPNTDDMAVLEAFASKGAITDIVAPNAFHHLYVAPWAARFPSARVWAAPGLREKEPSVRWTHDLSPTGETALDGDLAVIAVEGAPKASESVIVHKPTKSLLVADLLFNIRAPKGVVTNIALVLNGTRDRLALSRMWKMLTKDRRAARESIARIGAQDFDRLVPSHGVCIDTGAHGPAMEALHWMATGG